MHNAFMLVLWVFFGVRFFSCATDEEASTTKKENVNKAAKPKDGNTHKNVRKEGNEEKGAEKANRRKDLKDESNNSFCVEMAKSSLDMTC